ncbi:Umecyanin-like protein [Drosera capensis]
MAGKYSTIRANGIFVLVCLAVVQLCSAQTVHVVGGSTGWGIPSSSSFYSTWAASQTFRVGDVLEFNFTTGFHSVATVTKSAYDTCNVTSPLALSTTGPVNITVESGTQYFFCTYPGHCDKGQKFTVSASASSPAPVVAPAPSPRATAPSPTPRAHAPAPSKHTAAPAPATVSKSPKKAPAASPSSNPAVSPTPSSTADSTPPPPTVASSTAGGSGGATPSPTTPPSSAPPAAAAGVLVSLVSVAVALLY